MYKESKRILAIIIMLVLAMPVMKAQNDAPGAPNPGMKTKFLKRSPEDKAKMLTDTLSSIVNLSADQYQKAYASNLKYVTEKDRIKSSGAENETTQKIANLKTRKTEIAAILTADQKSKWMEWKKVRKEQMQVRMGQMKKDHQGGAGKMQKSSPQNNSVPAFPMDDIDGM